MLLAILACQVRRRGVRSWSQVEPPLQRLSQAQLVRAADTVIKDAILEGAAKVSPDALKQALQKRQTFEGQVSSLKLVLERLRWPTMDKIAWGSVWRALKTTARWIVRIS
jgi:hypothetical protein